MRVLVGPNCGFFKLFGFLFEKLGARHYYYHQT